MIEYNDAFMGDGKELRSSGIIGFGASNRTPETSRVHKKSAKSARPAKPVTKGLARATVVLEPSSSRSWNVRVKGTRALVGTVRRAQGAGGKSYSYKLLGEVRSHSGFATRKEAVERLLEKA